MRRAAYKLGLLMMIVGLLGVYACGSSDVLDEVGQRYVTSLTIEDNDEETLDIDTVMGMCDNETEPFTNAFAILTLSVDENAAGVSLRSYSVDFTPLESPDGNGTVMPPALTSPGDGFSNFEVAAGGSADFTFTCISFGTKAEYAANAPAGLYGLYRIRFIFHFENTQGEDVDITVNRTVYLGNYDNC